VKIAAWTRVLFDLARDVTHRFPIGVTENDFHQWDVKRDPGGFRWRPLVFGSRANELVRLAVEIILHARDRALNAPRRRRRTVIVRVVERREKVQAGRLVPLPKLLLPEPGLGDRLAPFGAALNRVLEARAVDEIVRGSRQSDPEGVDWVDDVRKKQA